MNRKFLRICSLSIFFTACVAITAHAENSGVLRIYNWSDYTSPELIKKFETQTGIKVSIDTFDSNETLLSKLKAGQSGYDIAMPTNDFVPVLISQNLLEKINAPSLPGYQNIDIAWRNPEWDRDNAYSIPWDWGTTSFVVNSEKITTPVDSLKTLFEPSEDLKGKVGMFSSSSEVISLALVYLNKPQCDTNVVDLTEVQKLLENQRPFVKSYDSNGVMDRVLSGETYVQQMASGEGQRIGAQNKKISYVYAKEGGIAWMDNIVVPKGAPNLENARKFLTFMLQPENAALQSKFAGYPVGVIGAAKYLPPEFVSAPAYTPPVGWKKTFLKVCGADAIRSYDFIWTKLRR